jgi:hypothetical protein
MHDSVRHRASIFTDTYAPYPGLICPPPGEELVRWLAVVTPAGAAVYWTGAVEIPITKRPRLRLLSEDDLPKYLTEIERAELTQGVPARTVGAALLCAGVSQPRVRLAMTRMLAPDPLRNDGLPAAWRGQRRGDHIGAMLSLEAFRRLGRPAQALRAAVERDVVKREAGAVSAGLGLTDHERHSRDGVYGHDARRLRAYVTEGRALLNALGAWPWCHAPAGRLPRGWHAQEAFQASLTAWFWQAMDALKDEQEERLDFAFGALR